MPLRDPPVYRFSCGCRRRTFLSERAASRIRCYDCTNAHPYEESKPVKAKAKRRRTAKVA